jgi:DNA-binding transcriptional MerR regulator
MVERQMTIGELAKRAGVATSALRYWEELGLISAPVRISGQRRYPESAVGLVGMILLLRDVGFSLRESKALLASSPHAVDRWRTLAQRKLLDLNRQISKAQTARDAIINALDCPYDDIGRCPNFAGVVAARLGGKPLAEAHPRAEK